MPRGSANKNPAAHCCAAPGAGIIAFCIHGGERPVEGELKQDWKADAVSTLVAAARPALGLHLRPHLNGRNSDEYEKASSPLCASKIAQI